MIKNTTRAGNEDYDLRCQPLNYFEEMHIVILLHSL